VSPKLATVAREKGVRHLSRFERCLTPFRAPEGGWRLAGWASSRIAAGVTDRQATASARWLCVVEAEQVHGASVAVIRRPPAGGPVAGCDALVTDVPGVTLAVRTADCLPIFFADPRRGIVGIAHAGWRGLAASLPGRMITVFQQVFRSRPEELHVAIGPAIRACCYEVGPEFPARFEPFVQTQHGRRPFDSAQGGLPSGVEGRRTCDLIGAAAAQLSACGVRAERLLDTQRCTGCEPDVWFSLRREGPQTGRLCSWIMVRYL